MRRGDDPVACTANLTPMAVLNENRAASGVEEFGPPVEVHKLAATVQLDAVEAVLCHGVDIAFHVRCNVGEVRLGEQHVGEWQGSISTAVKRNTLSQCVGLKSSLSTLSTLSITISRPATPRPAFT